MKAAISLAVKNCKRKPVRSLALTVLAAFLSLSIFAGSLIVMSLQNGLSNYEERLGADILVVPYEAHTKGKLESILLQGIPGYFYMDNRVLEKIRGIEGVEAASPQFYLASASAGCCSVAVQLIGFDPESDFVIKPWIQKSYNDTIGDGDLILGNHVAVPVNHSLRFFNHSLRVVAQLDETGTGLDNAVYANMNTVKQLLNDSDSLGFHFHSNISSDRAISSVMIRVADGYSIQGVTDDINIHIRKVEATQAKSMISGIARGLSSVSSIIGILTVMIWLLALAVLMISFIMIANERRKEFAILRVIGATKNFLSAMMLAEASVISFCGSILGLGIASLIAFPFSTQIGTRLNLPYLMPDAGTIVLLMVGAVLISVLAGSLSSTISAKKTSHSDISLVLWEGA